MGYYGNGFVFTAPADWAALPEVFPDSVGLRVYKHRHHDVWFLDAWGLTKREHWPFCDDLPEELSLPITLPAVTTQLLASFQALCDALPSNETPYGIGWLRMTAQLSHQLGLPCFFFAADDELTDMACSASQGMLQEFSVRFGACAAELSSGQLRVVPFDLLEDPEANLTEEQVVTLSQVPGVSISGPKSIEDGMPLYGNATRLWPVGEPAALLGVGTWDPFEHVGRDLEVVFERGPAPVQPASPAAPTAQSAPATPKKPWWRVWQ